MCHKQLPSLKLMKIPFSAELKVTCDSIVCKTFSAKLIWLTCRPTNNPKTLSPLFVWQHNLDYLLNTKRILLWKLGAGTPTPPLMYQPYLPNIHEHGYLSCSEKLFLIENNGFDETDYYFANFFVQRS